MATGFWIAYVYLACLLILSLMRVTIRAVVDFVGRYNAFGPRNAIARERGIAAYRGISNGLGNTAVHGSREL
jgi:hypothetical protein